MINLLILGIGDWGLGIGDCNPNPQSPIPNRNNKALNN